MSHARIAAVLCWAMMGCAAADGGFLTRVKERLRGKKDSADEATAAANSTVPANVQTAAKNDNVVPATADLSNKCANWGRSLFP